MISGYLRCLWGANVENYKLRWEYDKRWCISGVHDFCLNFMYFIILFIPHLQDLNMKDTNPNPLSLHLYLKSARTNQLDTNSLNSYTVHCFLPSPISLTIFAGQVCSPILLANFTRPVARQFCSLNSPRQFALPRFPWLMYVLSLPRSQCLRYCRPYA